MQRYFCKLIAVKTTEMEQTMGQPSIRQKRKAIYTMSIVSVVIYFQMYVEIRIRMRITATTKLRDSDSDIFLCLFSPSQILPKLLLHVLSLPKLKSHADCCMAFLIHQITKRHLFKIKTYRHIKKKKHKKNSH